MVKQSKVRIIGGKWRGRKITLPDVTSVRPSPDRVRETLFNWLAPVIQHAHVLDVFAGSGVLGFEALSRGADSVLMLDNDARVVKQLLASKKLLQAEQAEITCHSFPKPLPAIGKQFDIVFLDPPFHQQMIAPAFFWLHNNHYLAENAMIYVEAESDLTPLPILPEWQVIKHKQAGQVAYSLIQV